MLKAALILDGNSIKRWQKEALDYSCDLLDIVIILSCKNTVPKRKYFKNFIYYVVNYFTLKNKYTKNISLDLEDVNFLEFESIYDGDWQKIPSSALDKIRTLEIDIILKFGMNLLRIDEELNNLKIFSYHHGDPSLFRGRPAGFYELLQLNNSVGTIVQELSNKIDAGKIWAIGHSKVYHYSYKKTVINFFSNSKFLLRKSLLNLKHNTPVEILCDGTLYKLPNNLLVLKFLIMISIRKFKHLIYGCFFEKKWNIVTYEDRNIFESKQMEVKSGTSPKIDSRYSFYADPQFSSSASIIRVEALNSLNGVGEILEIDSTSLETKKRLLKGRHFAYPQSICVNDEEFLFPEVAAHSSPYLLRQPFDGSRKLFLKGIEKYRIIDGTLFKKDDTFYLFCGLNLNASDCLYLFYANSIEQEFNWHPLNPIIINPIKARMGGRIVSLNDKYYRFGQNNAYEYGNGLTVCEITKLTTTEYEEKEIGTLRFLDANGPHTVDISKNQSVFDFYTVSFSFLALYRRIIPKIFSKYS
jgi:hypothetical protein